MRLQMGHSQQFLTASVFISSLVNLSDAFFPTPWKEVVFGAGGVSHMEQTEQAFQSLATKYFPTIDHLSKSMINARDTISQANADVDKDQDHSALHCDGENFDGAQSRLQSLHTEVITNLNNNDVDAARKSLGSALHTVQDFYAHSNYVEMGNSAPSDLLGRAGTIPHAAFTDQTCKGCITTINPLVCNDCSANEAGFLGLLTSGYYFGEDSPPAGTDIPAIKCHHGGFTDNSFGSSFGFVAGKATQGINKDSLNCGFSPHYYAHSDAVSLAIQATEQYIDDIKQEITESQLRQLFGVGPTLAFCIDTTGSMGDIISSVQEQSIAIVTERIGTADEPSSYVISPFNDPDTGPVTVTSDFNVFQSTIDSLTAEGGGDCPELSMTGILNALDVLDDDSILFMFTDAASKDADLAGQVISTAVAKNINIYIFKFDSDCDDGLVGKREDSGADKVYGAVCLATSGQYHSLPRAEVSSLSGIIDTLTSVDNSFILRIAQPTPTSGSPIVYKAPVDSVMTQLSISLLGVGASMTISTPNGSPLDLTATTVSNVVLSDGEFVTVRTPDVGIWSVSVTATGNYTLDVSGISALHFTSFVFSELAGRPGHSGFFPIDGVLPYNIEIAAIGEIDGSFSTAEFDFRTPEGALIKTVPMTPGTGVFGDPPANSFFTLLTLTPGDFYVYLSGLDSAGKAYQRALDSVVTPTFSNATFNVSTTTLPSGNGTSSTTSISSSSARYTNATTTLKSASSMTYSAGFTTTEIVHTTVTTCPVTYSTTVSGKLTYVTTYSLSTMTLTSTTMAPCESCTNGQTYATVAAPVTSATAAAVATEEVPSVTLSVTPSVTPEAVIPTAGTSGTGTGIESGSTSGLQIPPATGGASGGVKFVNRSAVLSLCLVLFGGMILL